MVRYEPLHPEIKPVEYVRLILMFTAKLLYNIAPHEPIQRDAFFDAFEVFGGCSFEDATNAVRLLNSQIQVSESDLPVEGSKISAVLGYENVAQRSIWTNIPMKQFPNQAFDSWIAVIQTSLPKLDQQLRRTLQSALAFMGHEFTVGGADCATVTALVSVPNQAFHYGFRAPPSIRLRVDYLVLVCCVQPIRYQSHLRWLES